VTVRLYPLASQLVVLTFATTVRHEVKSGQVALVPPPPPLPIPPTHAPLTLQTSPSAHKPHEPPHPSAPQERPLHEGVQAVQTPAPLHEPPAGQVPQMPPQPSLPQVRPLQFLVHA